MFNVGSSSSSKAEELSERIASMNLANTSHCTNDNLTSSRDSINAIPPSDIENLETDVEENTVTVPFADQFYRDATELKVHNGDIVVPHFNIVTEAAVAAPAINSQTCFVSGNTNMILNHMNDNFMYLENTNSAPAQQMHQPQQKSPSDNAKLQDTSPNTNVNVKVARSKDLEKRKLSQNLDNFSLRLGQSFDVEAQRKTNERREKDKDRNKEKEQKCSKSMAQSADEKRSTEYVAQHMSLNCYFIDTPYICIYKNEG